MEVCYLGRQLLAKPITMGVGDGHLYGKGYPRGVGIARYGYDDLRLLQIFVANTESNCALSNFEDYDRPSTERFFEQVEATQLLAVLRRILSHHEGNGEIQSCRTYLEEAPPRSVTHTRNQNENKEEGTLDCSV